MTAIATGSTSNRINSVWREKPLFFLAAEHVQRIVQIYSRTYDGSHRKAQNDDIFDNRLLHGFALS